MKYTTQKSILLFVFGFLFVPLFALAHQPRLNTSIVTPVIDPEISKAYYGTLDGSPHTYTIKSDIPFNLYVNILVPDNAGAKKDVSVMIVKDMDTLHPFYVLNSMNFEWKKFFEPFGHDTYWQGPEYKGQVEKGTYDITVFSPKNDSKYSLAVGEREAFDFKEGMNALKLVPQLKKDFFDESPIGFILSPMSWGIIVIMYILAFIFGFIFRAIARKFAKSSTSKASKNINITDRLIRAGLGIILLLLAILSTWNLLLIFISGFAIFESIFSWCGFNQMIGKNTCPVE